MLKESKPRAEIYIGNTIEYDVLFFWSSHRYQIACSLLGGFSKPITAAIQSLDSVPLLVRLMCYGSPSTDGSGPPLSPPSEIPPELLVYSQFSCVCIYHSSSFRQSVIRANGG